MSVNHVASGVVRIDAPLPLRSPTQINCYLLRDALPAGDLLVDTGMRESRATIDAALESVAAQIGGVLITHGHIDHWGTAVAYGETVLAHPGSRVELDFAAGRTEPDAADLPFEGSAEVFAAYRRLVDAVPAVEPIEDGTQLGEWRVIWTPGHAPGHICLFRERDGVLVAGDQLLPGFTPNIQPGLDGGDALADFLDSLDRLDELPIRLVLPAHGDPFTDARGRVSELRAHHSRRLDQLRTRCADGGATLPELTRLLFRGLEEQEDRFLATLETYAHLVHLERRGGVERHGACWRAGVAA